MRWAVMGSVGVAAGLGAFLFGAPLLLALAIGTGAIWVTDVLDLTPSSPLSRREMIGQGNPPHAPSRRHAGTRTMRRRVLAGLRRATPIALMMAFFGAWHTAVNLAKPQGSYVSPPGFQIARAFGLSAVVFTTYLTLAVAGYRVRADGDSDAPRPIAWLVVALALIAILGPIFYFGVR